MKYLLFCNILTINNHLLLPLRKAIYVMKDKKAKQLVVLFFPLLTVSAQSVAQTTIEKQLDEVVVQVAYGSATKSTLTGAVSQIESKDIQKRPVTSVTSALEGAVAGVQVNSSYGQPGSEPSINIRGFGTVNGGNNQPLYIIDGVAFGGNISDLNANDIESISVLKDAASCALYGNRASNGVVLITTKRGRSEKMNFNLKLTQGTYSRGMNDYKLLDAKQFMEASWMSLRNSRMTNTKINEDQATANAYASANLIKDELKLNIFNKADDELFTEDGKLVSDASILPGYTDDLDWYDQVMRRGYRQEYNFSGSQSTRKSDFFFSLGYLDEDGYVKNTGFDRLSGRANINMRPTRWLRTGVNISGTHQNKNSATSTDLAFGNVFYTARFMAPIYPVHLHASDGSYLLDDNGNRQYDTGSYTSADGLPVTTRSQMLGRNLIWENELNRNESVRNTGNAIAYADIMFLNDFTFTVKGDYNLRSDRYTLYYSSSVGEALNVNGRLQKTNYDYKNYTFQQQLKWAHAFGDHTLSLLLGHENYSLDADYTLTRKCNESVTGSTYLSQYATIETANGYHMRYRTESYLGRIRYNYLDRYNVEASFRRDGSSRFAKNKRWGNFGSIGANWVVSKEKFMQSVGWINFLKLRADYGRVGNDDGVGYNAYKTLYSSTFTNGGVPATFLLQMGNDDLQWETGESWGVALEARLFDRWNLSVEYFDKRNKDLLFDVYQALSTGSTTVNSPEEFSSLLTRNIGSISNRGVEISTDVDIFRNKDWRVNFAANATFISNKVLTLPEQNKNGIVSEVYKVEEGKSRFNYYTYTYVGVDQMNGKALYKADLDNYKVMADGNLVAGNADGKDISSSVTCIDGNYYVNAITYAKKEEHGSAMPKVYGSFSPTISYKSLTLSALFTYSLGGKVYDYVYRRLMTSSTSPQNYHADILKSWSSVPEGMTDESPNRIWVDGIPMINSDASANNNAESSRWLTNASYIVLKNLYLSYQLPKQWMNALKIEGAQLSLSCENLFTATKRRGMNPQQNVSGYQYNNYVTPRVITIGLDIKF